jgi:hypothetical protein
MRRYKNPRDRTPAGARFKCAFWWEPGVYPFAGFMRAQRHGHGMLWFGPLHFGWGWN